MKTVLRTPFLVAAAVMLAVALAACGSSESDSASDTREGKSRGERKDRDERKASSEDLKVLDTSSAKGSFPATLVRSNIEKPTTIKVKVAPKPAAKAAVSWTVACRKGRRARTTDGRFRVTKTATKTLKDPLKGSDSCVVSASVQMSKNGTITLQIIG